MNHPTFFKNIENCKVEPSKAISFSKENFKISEAEGIGGAGIFWTWALSWIAFAWIGFEGWAPFFMGIILAIGSDICFRYFVEREEMAISKNIQSKNEVIRNAELKTQELKNYYSSISFHYDRIINIHATISRNINLANNEFRARAFAPYWDAVESSLKSLNDLKENMGYFEQSLESYNSSFEDLKYRNHSFPAAPSGSQLIPDINNTVAHFKRVIRLGQTDYEFASIWEDRLTRNVLVKKFGSLEGSINNLEKGLNSDISKILRLLSAK